MPDRRPARLLGAVAAGLLAGLLVAPAALAQEVEGPLDEQPVPTPDGDRWEGSRFGDPFGEDATTLDDHTFDVRGTMTYRKSGPADFIEEVEVRVVDAPGDSFSPGDGCTLPEPDITVGRWSDQDGFNAERPFRVDDVTVACNGRYVVQAEGRLESTESPQPTHTIERSFVLAIAPEAVTGLGVTLDGRARAVTVTFQPLADGDLAPDALGYVVERSGPAGSAPREIARIGLDDEARFVDPLTDAPAGDYTYRVRAVRAGPDGEVRSSVEGTESDTITVEGDPSTSTPSTSAPTTSAKPRGAAGSRSRSGGGVTIPRTSSTSRATTPTTLDTGFEDTLDYGELPEGGERGEAEELAGDEPVAGQSIVQDEGDSVDLAVPAAGALVMLGWAGHIAYLNRLAKQL